MVVVIAVVLLMTASHETAPRVVESATIQSDSDVGSAGSQSDTTPSSLLAQQVQQHKSSLPSPFSDESPVSRLSDDLASDQIELDQWAVTAAKVLTGSDDVSDRYRGGTWDPTYLMSALRESWPSVGPRAREEILGMGFYTEGDGVLFPPALYPAITCTYSTANFDIHYDSSTLGWTVCGAPPLYVTKAATYFEGTRTRFVDEMGWTPPPSDGGAAAPGCSSSGGSPKYDVFLTMPPELTDPITAGWAWGYTQTACIAQKGTGSAGDNENSAARAEQNAYSSFIRLSPNPSSLCGGCADPITFFLDQIAAHEFHHSLQFGYSINGKTWLQESTAHWAVTQFDPAAWNWLFNGEFLKVPDYTLTSLAGPALRPYASWLFHQYYAEHYGGVQRIREIWEELAATNEPGSALRNAMVAAGTTLDTVYKDFAIALKVMSDNSANAPYTFATSGNWPGGYAAQYREVSIEATIPFTGSPPIPYDSRLAGNQRLEPLGTDYIAIGNSGGLPFKACVSQVELAPVMSVSLVKQRTGDEVASVQAPVGSPPCFMVDDAPAWNDFTLVISYNSAGPDPNLNYYIEVALISFPGPATDWYFAEGYTGPGFQQYLDIQNPGEIPAHVDIRYQLNGGGEILKTINVAPKQRATVDVNGTEFGVGPGREVSTRITSDSPVVAERPMYFRYNGSVGGHHNALGARSPATSWYFAEGYTAPGFDQYLTLQNPSVLTATAVVSYHRSAGPLPDITVTLPPKSRTTRTVHSSSDVGRGFEVSTKVTSDSPIVAERPMYFFYGGSWDGGHVVVGANSPSTQWSFAEGYTGGGFDEYITVQNPGLFTANVTTTYQLGGGGTKVTGLQVPALSRRTIHVHSASEAGRNVEVSARLNSDQPIVAERPMYFGYNLAYDGSFVSGGHDAMGITTTARAYYFASGETTSSYDEYLTIQNANPLTAYASVLYMHANGLTESRRYALPPNSRSTITVFADIGRNKYAAAAIFSNEQIVVERPTYMRFGSSSIGGVVTGGAAVIGAAG